jgi:hypothetical protein
MFGFIEKKCKSKIKLFVPRWWFLVSSRPLNMIDFMNDNEVLPEAALPPIIEFDTLYYFCMGNENDTSSPCGTIKVSDIVDITLVDMEKIQKEPGHSFLIDTGMDNIYLMTKHRFEMERWVEGIIISMQTARESKLSITGKTKNIAKVVSHFDMNIGDVGHFARHLGHEIVKLLPPDVEDWDRNIDDLIGPFQKVSDLLIETFDACLSLRP